MRIDMEDSGSRHKGATAYDAIVIGAGVAGIYQLYRLKKLGMKAITLEAASGVGGVWWWNRYPGARLDSESYSYAYSFSKELLDEWNWSEHFATQEELHRYFEFAVDKLGLRQDMLFNRLVTAARFDEASGMWRVSTESGECFVCRYLIAAVGPLTAPTYPKIPGLGVFRGESYHTSRWPAEDVSFSGKRVAVIGTGATGIQVVQEAAKTAAHLTVFQRTPNYCAPLNNAKIDDAQQPALKARYDEIIKRCRSTNSWFLHDADPRSVFDLTAEERQEFLDNLYRDRGIGIWKANFHDIATDPAANEIVSEYMRNRIRQRVKDSAVAEMLIPHDYGFGSRRVPLETGYYEVFNQPNVALVDVRATPIECFTETSIVTSQAAFDVDLVVFATGFDAVTGSFDRINIEGLGKQKLREKWTKGPVTFLGVHSAGFPNFFMPGGPLASVGNFTPALEFSVDWISDMLAFMQRHGFDYVDANPSAEREWTDEVRRGQQKLLMGKVKSWFTGVNSNVEGHEEPRVVLYVGSAQAYRDRCQEVRQGRYRELEFRRNHLGGKLPSPAKHAVSGGRR